MANPTTVEGLLSAVQNHGHHHRSSLSAPVAPKSTGGAHIDFGAGPQCLPRYNRNRSVSGGQYSVYGAFPHPKPVPWLNKLCHEPEGDIGTCCLGFWLPCALYGNTQYRLKQMAQGDDPLDLREHKHNNGPCWMHQMLCFFFRCEWCVVMLQHSRIRATYNIDGTAGGDCVQSYYCPCCTLMQDEREVVAREQRILRQQSGTGEVTQQPGFEPQMRYSTSNLLEEIPEIFRENMGGRGSYPSSTQGLTSGEASSRTSARHSFDGRDEKGGKYIHEMADLGVFAVGNSDGDSDPDDERRRSRSRRSSRGSGKLKIRETSPLGSALNPITVTRSVSVDRGKGKSKPQTTIPQRSVTSPTRRKSLAGTNPPPTKSANYRLKSITTDDRPDFLIDTIREGSETSTPAATINSRTAVKSLAMESLRSVASKHTSGDSARAKQKPSSESRNEKQSEEAYTTFYNEEGKLVRRRISECLRPRASTPETPDIYQLHHANPNDDARTLQLKDYLAREAEAEERGAKGKSKLLVKLKAPPKGGGSSSSANTANGVAETEPMLLATITVAKSLPAGSVRLSKGGVTVGSGSKAKIQADKTALDQLAASHALFLATDVNHADDLATYLDQAVKDSGLKLKNQKSLDLSAMPNDAIQPRTEILRLGFNSEDSGSDPPPSPLQIAYGLEEPYKVKKADVLASTRMEAHSTPNKEPIKTGIDAVDRYPSYIATSDGAGTSPDEVEPGTPLGLELEDGRKLDDVVASYGQLTPRHKKSVSDWFKDVARSSSVKSDKSVNTKTPNDDVPPVPDLPAEFKEQGYSLGPLRSFSPLGFKDLVSRGKSKGKSAFSTIGPAQKLAPPSKGNRTVSAPPAPATVEPMKAPLGDATNNADVILETQDKLQALQEEFKFTAEEVTYEINNLSPSPTPAAVGDNWGTGWPAEPSPPTIAITSSATTEIQPTQPQKTHRSFPLVNSAKSTPNNSLSKASGKTAPIIDVDVEVGHARRGADTSNANVYDSKTLISTIKQLSATPIYSANSPTVLAQSMEDVGLGLPENLDTPSAIPKGLLEHMPGEFPMTPFEYDSPMELEGVVVDHLSPAKYFPRTESLAVEHGSDMSSEPVASTCSGESESIEKTGHVYEDQEVEVANQFDSTTAAEVMNTTMNARIVSCTLDGVKETDPFNHPFFGGTAVIDFALVNPRERRQDFEGSDEMGSEETIRPAPEANPLATQDSVLFLKDKPVQNTASDNSVYDSNHPLAPIREMSSPDTEVTNKSDFADDRITVLPPPLDHPTTAERIDDALAATLVKPRSSSMHGTLTQPILESDDLRTVCDRMNRGSLSYESDDGEEIVTVGANGPVTPKARKEKEDKRVVGVKKSDTVVRRSMSPERAPRTVSPATGKSRLQNALMGEVGGVPKIVIGEKEVGDMVEVEEGVGGDGATALLGMPPPVSLSPKRVHSPAEVMLRGMLGIGKGKERERGMDSGNLGLVAVSAKGGGGDGAGEVLEGAGVGGGGGGGSPKKKNSKNSPQRRRARAEKKRRERAAGEAGESK